MRPRGITEGIEPMDDLDYLDSNDDQGGDLELQSPAADFTFGDDDLNAPAPPPEQAAPIAQRYPGRPLQDCETSPPTMWDSKPA